MTNTPPQKHVQLYRFSVCMLSHVQLFVTPSTEFPRQEYWSGLPLPTPVDLPNPGTNLHLLQQQVDSSLLCHWEAHTIRLKDQKWKRNYLNSPFPGNLSSLIRCSKFYNLGFFCFFFFQFMDHIL